MKGPEPHLYECLAATFRQNYPSQKLTIYLCISSDQDPAFPVLKRVLDDFPNHDARILVEAEDPYLMGPSTQRRTLGPNPKIRNISRGYREAKGDIIWVLDCNVWVGSGAAGRMVDKLCGLSSPRGRKYKFVHQLPLVVDAQREAYGTGNSGHSKLALETIAGGIGPLSSLGKSAVPTAGGRLEEMFMASSHAKFYTAINTVLIAPCIVGKSNMFRRSHLNYLTSSNPHRTPGIDTFSDYICEDHLIGDLLWKKKVGEEKAGEKWGKHALVFGDLAIQPMGAMGLKEYIARRARWLRVRKNTVRLATLVEPGTESFLCSVFGAYAITTFARFLYGVPLPQAWLIFGAFWLCSVAIWAFIDWTLYWFLHGAYSIEINEHTPFFVKPPTVTSQPAVGPWILAWLGREALAFPIWVWAVWGGATVEWRGKRFRVHMDMTAHALPEERQPWRFGLRRWKSKKA